MKVWLAEFLPDEVSIEKKKHFVIWIFLVPIYQWKEIFKKNSFPEFEKILNKSLRTYGIYFWFISDHLVLIDSWVNWSTLMGKFRKGNIPVNVFFKDWSSWRLLKKLPELVKFQEEIQHSLDLIQDTQSVPWTANSFFTGSKLCFVANKWPSSPHVSEEGEVWKVMCFKCRFFISGDVLVWRLNQILTSDRRVIW